jgi:ACS family hexuronate transporter-like MFS transporter
VATLLGDRRTWGIAGAKVLSDQIWWLLLFWAPDFFHRVFGVGVAQLGAPLALAYTGSALGSVVAGWAGTRLLARGHSLNIVRKGVMLACALLVTTIPLALHTRSLWVAAGLLALTLAGHQGFSVNVFATITDITPRSRVGVVTSFGAFCGNLAGMGIVYLAGQILTAGLGYAPLLAIAAVSYLLGVLWLHLWVPKLIPAPAEA